jgi:hypothetical protein
MLPNKIKIYILMSRAIKKDTKNFSLILSHFFIEDCEQFSLLLEIELRLRFLCGWVRLQSMGEELILMFHFHSSFFSWKDLRLCFNLKLLGWGVNTHVSLLYLAYLVVIVFMIPSNLPRRTKISRTDQSDHIVHH